MFGVVREYSVEARELDGIVERIIAEFVPIIVRTVGLVSYTVATSDNGDLVTTTLCADRENARASTKLAADWARKNLAELLQMPAYVSEGGLLLLERAENPKAAAFGVMRRYHFRPSTVQEIAARVRSNLAPMLTRAEGFSGYAVIDSGDGEVVSLTSFSDKRCSDEANAGVLAWVKEYLSPYGPPPKVTSGHIRFRHVNESAFAEPAAH